MASLLKSIAKKMPGLRGLVTHRDAAEAERDRLAAHVEKLADERHRLRDHLAGARIDPETWRPAYVAGQPAAEQHWDRFFEVCRQLGLTSPYARVLDMGCGVGGVAQRFADYLSDYGSFDGFDVDARAVAACNDAIRRPNFSFCAFDVHNEKYNPFGRLSSTAFTFPYPDAAYDLIVLRSVFTHTWPETTDHYLSEIGRLLAPEGRCLVTLFLLTDGVLGRLVAGAQRSNRRFSHDFGDYRTDVADEPLAAIAVTEAWFRRAAARNGLEIVEPIHEGEWSGRAEYLLHHDLVVLRRAGAETP